MYRNLLELIINKNAPIIIISFASFCYKRYISLSVPFQLLTIGLTIFLKSLFWRFCDSTEETEIINQNTQSFSTKSIGERLLR